MADELIRFCATKDSVAALGFCRWPDGAILWAVTDAIPGVPEDAFRAAIAWALGECAAVCGIVPVETEAAAKARILCGTRHIDGPSGVLAESELPCGNVRRCRQWYDGSESWDWTWPGVAAGKISLHLVVLHELLHALGLPHAPENADAVIAPTYNARLTGLRPYDVNELRRRYGPPKATPPPVIPPIPTPAPGGIGAMLKGLLLKIIRRAVESFAESAKKTPEPGDDILAMVLLKVLDLFDVQAVTSKAEAVAALRAAADQVEQA